MKILQAVSTYQLLELLVYRYKYINEDQVVLLVPEWIKPKIVNTPTLNTYFSKILYFNDFPNYSDPQVSKHIIDYYDNLFNQNNISIDQCEEFQVAGAQYGIGNYLCLKEIPFTLWEDSAGIISKPEILKDIEANLSVKRLEFNDSLGLFDGTSPYIKKIFGNINAQSGDTPSNFSDFDIVSELGNMDVNERNKIISIFTSSYNIEIPPNATLLLTEHFANCKRLTFEDQVLIYQLYFDYFLQNETVVIKPHPDDLMYYDQLFENVRIIYEKFPAEFIPYIFSNKPKKLATISSASAKSLNEQFDNILFLGNDFEKRFRTIHRYFLALNIALNLQDYQEINKLGTYNILLDTLVSTKLFNIQPLDTVKTQVHIIDDYDENVSPNEIIERLTRSNDNECFIFINSLEKYLFFDVNNPEIWNDIVPVIIQKKLINEKNIDFYSALEDEKLFVFTRNTALKERINKMNMKQPLKNTNICLEKNTLDNHSLEIEILKGKLKATEKRLLYYINLVETLEKDK